MVLIETDILLALISRTDRHHVCTVKFLESLGGVKLSPYSLIEVDLLIESGNIKVKLPDFYSALEEVFSYYMIENIPPKPSHFIKSREFRKEYGLTYFDSLHAAVAFVENELLISYDKIYRDVKEIKYRSPRDFQV